MSKKAWIFVGFVACAAGITWLWKHDQSGRQQSPAAEERAPARQILPITVSRSQGATTPTGILSSQFAMTNVASQLNIAVGKGKERDYHSRLKAIGKLGVQLTESERKILYDYLRDTGNDKWLRPGQDLALKNEMLNTLSEQERVPAELTGFLVNLSRDTAQPLVIRDYALQQLASWYPRAGRDDRDLIVQELQSVARDKTQSYAGTALLGLRRIQEEDPVRDFPLLQAQIRRLIEDNGANLLARISAVQLAGSMALAQLRPAVKLVAAREDECDTLRIAAIGALGRLGSAEDLALLDTCRKGENKRFQLAAQSALEVLNTGRR